MTSMLTPQVSEEALAAALDAFRSVLGPDAVLAGADELREFRDPFAYATWDDYTASAVVMPRRSRRSRQIVRIANEHRVPLWTHGAGKNNGYGGPAPRVKRLGDREPAQHEPRARDQRGAAPTRSSSRACAGSTSTTRSRPAGTG